MLLTIRPQNDVSLKYKQSVSLLADLPRTIRTPPTEVRSSGPGRPSYWPVCAGHVTDTVSRRRTSRGRGRASSSSAPFDTGHPRRTSENTRSIRSSPTWSRHRETPAAFSSQVEQWQCRSAKDFAHFQNDGSNFLFGYLQNIFSFLQIL